MKQLVTQGIVLSRTHYGEADRIVTFLTPDAGKITLMVRGVRRIKSKLAGGIELFSVSDITYIAGRGSMGTLISARLKHHYGDITMNIDRVQLGYELIKQLNRATEDNPEPEYFDLLQQCFAALNKPDTSLEVILAWYYAHLLRLAGHTPNVTVDQAGKPLSPTDSYQLDYESMSLHPTPHGPLQTDHIKVMRLLFGDHTLSQIGRIQAIDEHIAVILPTLRNLNQLHAH